MTDSADRYAALHARQHEFAAHLRNPAENPAPADVEDRRMAIYRELFINNVTRFLANSFPVLADMLGKERWELLIRDFYSVHTSRSPLFPDMPKELLDYLTNERDGHPHSDPEADPPFLYELAHYEWAETGLALAEDPMPDPAIDYTGNLLDEHPVPSSLAWLFSYNYPVNEIGKNNWPEAPAAAPVYYLLYRDAADKVQFSKLNIVSARLFELLSNDAQLSGRAALERIAAELQYPDPDRVVTDGTSMLRQWRDRNIILGTLACV
jgi:uncharacterized protein